MSQVINPIERSNLTERQFDLLVWLYTSGFKSREESSLVWSPKAYLGRSPTASEAATLSQRKSSLIGRGLIKEDGRVITLSPPGRERMQHYAREHPNKLNDEIRSSLQIDADSQMRRAIWQVIRAIGDFYPAVDLKQKEAITMQRTLMRLGRVYSTREKASIQALQRSGRKETL